MTNIQRKIENLKPGKEYILTVRAKNADLNVASSYAESIRFQVPTDQTIPGQITGFQMVSNFEKIMFIFNINNDADLKGYFYEVYSANTTDPAYRLYDGFSSSNIFTIAVDNTTRVTNNSGATPAFTTTTTQYWGRVRMVDTSGNLGPWSTLETSGSTPLISEEFIDNLTASKISAGTIGAHTITLQGGTSIIKSSTFDGTVVGDPAGGIYTGATTGWLITGNGKAYFYDASIAGSIDIGGFDSTSFHVDTSGNVWIGAGTYSTAPFRVSNDGIVRVGAGATSLYINNNGSINIGSSLGTGTFQLTNDGELTIGTSPNLFKIYTTGVVEIGSASTPGGGTTSLWVDNSGALTIGTANGVGNFKVQSTGQVDIGTGSTSMHIDISGNMWTGANSTSFSTAPFKLSNDGSLDIGGSDATSLHLSASGEVYSGVAKGGQASAPFLLTPNTGAIRVGAVTGSYTGFGITNGLYLNDTMYIGNNLIRGSDSGNVDSGLNFYLRASTGFTGRSGTTVLISIGPSGISVTGLPITTTGDVTGFMVRTTSNGSSTDPSYKFAVSTDGFYTDGTHPYWSNSGTGTRILTVSNASANATSAGLWSSSNDGSGSGLDADKVDGIHASSFLRSDTSDTCTGNITAASLVVNSGSFIESSGNLQINSGGTAAYFNNSNGGTLGKLSSSLRYKENVKAIENEELNPKNLLQAKIYQFTYKDDFLLEEDKGRGVVFPGFIVEELVEIYPKAVAIDDEGRPDGWNPNYIIPPMLELIKELYTRIEELEGKVNG